MFCRGQHECTAHVFWRKCPEAPARGDLVVIGSFHRLRCCVGTGGWTQVHADADFSKHSEIVKTIRTMFHAAVLVVDREILGSEQCWQYLLASNAIPGFIQLATLPWFPESPRYLLIDRGDKEACVHGAVECH